MKYSVFWKCAFTSAVAHSLAFRLEVQVLLIFAVLPELVKFIEL